jgi:hypothetical protein
MDNDLITKPEVTEHYVRIPVSARQSGDRIRTITVSASQGIKALYAANRKKILTYLFARSKGWTMSKARAWVQSHRKSIEEDTMKEKNRFQFEIPILKAKEKITKDKEGNEKIERYIEGVASSTNVDLHGDRMDPSAIKSMAESLKQHVIMLNAEHDKSWQSELGELTNLDVVKQDKNQDLVLEAKLDEMSKANDLWYALTDKKKKLGLSIGGYVKEYEMVKDGEDDEGFPRWHRVFKDIELDHVAVTSSPANPKTWVSAIEKSLDSKTDVEMQVRDLGEDEKRELVLKLLAEKPAEEIRKVIGEVSAERTSMGTSPLKTEEEEKDEIETKTATDESESSESVNSETGDDGQEKVSDGSEETPKAEAEESSEAEANGEESPEAEGSEEESPDGESDSEETSEEASVEVSADETEEKSTDDGETDGEKAEESEGESPAEEAEESSEDTDSEASDEEAADETKEASSDEVADVSAQLRKIADDLGDKTKVDESDNKEITTKVAKTLEGISKSIESIATAQEDIVKRLEDLESQPAGRKTAVDKGVGTDEASSEKSLEEAIKEAEKKYANNPNLFSIKQKIRKQYAENDWA